MIGRLKLIVGELVGDFQNALFREDKFKTRISNGQNTNIKEDILEME